MVLGEDGIIAQAKLAAEKTKETEEQAQSDLVNLVEEISNILTSDPPVPTKPTPTPKPTLKADGSFDSKKGVNSPKITIGEEVKLNPVYWDENGSEIEYYTDFANKTVNESFEIDKWYDYVDTTNAENTSHWANAKTADGSYWVWIPRYAYRITSGYHTNSATGGEIDIKFLQETGNKDSSGSEANIVASLNSIVTSGSSGPSTTSSQYVVHPAFINNPEKGGWNKELTGIWVAKFEASPQNADQIITNSEYDGTGKNLQVKPGVASWRKITVSNVYTVCKNYATNVLKSANLNSHLMKNSEWGAVAYLVQSKYGRNKKEVGVNECSNYITGAGPKKGQDVTGGSYPYSKDTSGSNYNFIETYSYTTDQGKKASTTGNVYGVYDMSGGSYEYVAAYVDNGNDNLSNYAQKLTEAKSNASWTVNVYKKADSESYSANYSANNNKYGDAIWETSNNSSASGNSWFLEFSCFPNLGTGVFGRGAYYGYNKLAGLFFLINCGGNGDDNGGFRPVLIIE